MSTNCPHGFSIFPVKLPTQSSSLASSKSLFSFVDIHFYFHVLSVLLTTAEFLLKTCLFFPLNKYPYTIYTPFLFCLTFKISP